MAEAKPDEKQPRHIAVATRHLVAQRNKAICIRDKAAKEVEELDSALLALGWTEQLELK
jgi:hypothetical protein